MKRRTSTLIPVIASLSLFLSFHHDQSKTLAFPSWSSCSRYFPYNKQPIYRYATVDTLKVNSRDYFQPITIYPLSSTHALFGSKPKRMKIQSGLGMVKDPNAQLLPDVPVVENFNEETTTPHTMKGFDDNSTMDHYQMTKQTTSEKNLFQLWIEQNILPGSGIPANPELLAIVTIYFVEGALGLARLAQSFLLKDELGLGPAELSALTGFFVLPWTIKPLYGFLSDGFPLFGYRRKSYLIVTGLLGSLSYAALGYSDLWDRIVPHNAIVPGTVAALLLSSACIAFTDVVADGIIVTKTRQADDPAVAGGLQSLCWGAAAVGGLLSAYFSGSLLEVFSVRSIFGITALLPFLVAMIAFGVDEQPKQVNNGTIAPTNLLEGVQVQMSTLWQALRQPSIWKPTLFLFLWQSTPTTDGAFFYFLTNDLRFGPEILGRIRLASAGAGLFGVWLYNQYLRRVKIKNILFWATLASFPLGMLPVLLITHVNRQLGIPDDMLIYGDDVALAALGQISFIPTLVLAARLCPPGVEAVLFATLMSINNGAGTVGTELGAVLTKFAGITDNNFDNLAWLTAFCNLTSLWPLLLIRLLDGAGDVSEEEIEAAPNGNFDDVSRQSGKDSQD